MKAIALVSSAFQLSDHFLQPSQRANYKRDAALHDRPQSSSTTTHLPAGKTCNLIPPEILCIEKGMPTSTTFGFYSDQSRSLISPTATFNVSTAIFRFWNRLPESYKDPSRPTRGGIPTWRDEGLRGPQGDWDGRPDTRLGMCVSGETSDHFFETYRN